MQTGAAEELLSQDVFTSSRGFVTLLLREEDLTDLTSSLPGLFPTFHFFLFLVQKVNNENLGFMPFGQNTVCSKHY